MSTLSLLDITNRPPALPWAEGDNIPWHNPQFSARMLQEHLSQEHDLASRRLTTVDHHVQWIHNHLLPAAPARILDLGCGPGLYSLRLAELGHYCTGIDYSPASIRHAQSQTQQAQLHCDFQLADIRTADYPLGCDLVMLIFGEWNVFAPAAARKILGKAQAALAHGGILLMEPHPFAKVRAMGQQEATWFSSSGGLFAATPHLVLMESTWHTPSQTATIRYYVIDGNSGAVSRYAQTFQAYTHATTITMLQEAGFGVTKFYSELAAETPLAPGVEPTAELYALAAYKTADN